MADPRPYTIELNAPIDPAAIIRHNPGTIERHREDLVRFAAYPNICEHIRGLIAEMERDNG